MFLFCLGKGAKIKIATGEMGGNKMYKMMKEREKTKIHNENFIKENLELESLIEENIKLKSIIMELKKYIEEL